MKTLREGKDFFVEYGDVVDPYKRNIGKEGVYTIPEPYIDVGMWAVAGDGKISITAVQPQYFHKGSAHYGLDIGADEGTSLVCPFNKATVVAKGDDSDGYGNYAVIQLVNGEYVIFGHMQKEASVSVGQRLSAGDPIGMVGNTGNSDAPHVHIQVCSSELSSSISGGTLISGSNKYALNALDYFQPADIKKYNTENEYFNGQGYSYIEAVALKTGDPYLLDLCRKLGYAVP